MFLRIGWKVGEGGDGTYELSWGKWGLLNLLKIHCMN